MIIVVFAVMFSVTIGPPLLVAIIADMTRARLTLLVSLTVAVVGYFLITNTATFQALDWKWTLPAPPAAETAFIAAADKLHTLRLNHASGAVLHDAKARLCAQTAVASGWVGRVVEKYLDDAGNAATLAVIIWPHVTLRTAWFPDDTNTLVRAGSPLFVTVDHLHGGETVRFSGRIMGHDGACHPDPPANRDALTRDPEFLFTFSRVDELPSG